MSNPKLALIPSGYKNSKVYSILPNDGSGDFTFARNSGGTRVNKQGLIEQMQTYGSQLLNNSDFTSTSDWTVSNTGSAASVIENGYLHINTSGDYSVATQAVGLTAGDIYRVDYEILENTAGTISIIGNGGASTIIPSTVGKHTIEYDAQSTFAVKRTTGSTNIKIAYIKLYKVQYNTPRLDWSDSNCPSLLLEPQSTNLITYSEDFTQWSNADVTIESGYLAPDGSNNAYKVTKTGSNANIVTSGVLTSDARTIYAKTTNGSGTIQLLSHNTNTNNLFTVTEQWQRFEVNSSLQVASNFYAIDFRGASTTLDELIIWGAQSEALSYATSYIPTYAGTSTRLADTCTGAGDATIFNDSEGVLYAEISSLIDNNDGSKSISISSGAYSNNIIIQYTTNTNQIVFKTSPSYTTPIYQPFTVSDITESSKIAFKYKLDDCSFWHNGVKLGSVTSFTPFSFGTLTELNFDRGDGNEKFEGKCKDLRYYDTALTDAELTELTT